MNIINLFATLSMVCFFHLGRFSVVFAQSGVIDNTSTPHMHLKSIGVNDCQWTEGFWADKVNMALESMIPNLGRLMDDPEIIHAYDNFKVAAGLKDGEFRGWAFHDGDFYKYVESLAYAYAMTKDEAINDKMDEIIHVIGQAQLPNGYLHTRKQIGHGIAGFHHESENRFDRKTEPFTNGPEHEFYNFGHMFTAACVHYRITGKDNFLNIAIKSADLLYSNL